MNTVSPFSPRLITDSPGYGGSIQQRKNYLKFEQSEGNWDLSFVKFSCDGIRRGIEYRAKEIEDLMKENQDKYQLTDIPYIEYRGEFFCDYEVQLYITALEDLLQDIVALNEEIYVNNEILTHGPDAEQAKHHYDLENEQRKKLIEKFTELKMNSDKFIASLFEFEESGFEEEKMKIYYQHYLNLTNQIKIRFDHCLGALTSRVAFFKITNQSKNPKKIYTNSLFASQTRCVLKAVVKFKELLLVNRSNPLFDSERLQFHLRWESLKKDIIKLRHDKEKYEEEAQKESEMRNHMLHVLSS